MILVAYIKLTFHLFKGFWIVLWTFHQVSDSNKKKYVQNWCGQLLDIFQVRLEVFGGTIDDQFPALVVSNHISWLDIHVLNAYLPLRFVSKKEVSTWPIFGVMAKKIRTLFIDRQTKGDSRNISNAIVEAFKDGDQTCIFPEGTSSDGTKVLPFHSGLFQSVINTQVPCIPVAISYQSVKTKKISTAPAFIGEMSLLQSIQSTLRESPLVVRLDIGEPLVGMSDRKVLSDKAREVILLLRGANNSAPK